VKLPSRFVCFCETLSILTVLMCFCGDSHFFPNIVTFLGFQSFSSQKNAFGAPFATVFWRSRFSTAVDAFSDPL